MCRFTGLATAVGVLSVVLALGQAQDCGAAWAAQAGDAVDDAHSTIQLAWEGDDGWSAPATRGAVAVTLTALLGGSTGLEPPAAPDPDADIGVPSDHYAYAAIRELCEVGVLVPDDDHVSMSPADDPMTRYEFALVLDRALAGKDSYLSLQARRAANLVDPPAPEHMPAADASRVWADWFETLPWPLPEPWDPAANGGEAPDRDVPGDVPWNHWAYEAVCDLYFAGVLVGVDGKGTISGDDAIPKGEALSCLRRALVGPDSYARTCCWPHLVSGVQHGPDETLPQAVGRALAASSRDSYLGRQMAEWK
jgi:hypothetical protein